MALHACMCALEAQLIFSHFDHLCQPLKATAIATLHAVQCIYAWLIGYNYIYITIYGYACMASQHAV